VTRPAPRPGSPAIVDNPAPGDDTHADALARTRIPRALWDDRQRIYVGLEIYLAQPGAGGPDDWRFASELIGHICDCGAMH
jgi:hypothetical protein